MYAYVLLPVVTIAVMLECTTPVVTADEAVNRCCLKAATVLRR